VVSPINRSRDGQFGESRGRAGGVGAGDVAATRDPLSIPAEVKASLRILLVDDERTLRESCASVLQMDGYHVTVAGRGEEALELVKNRKFDMILVDCTCPRCRVWTFCARHSR
jgi:PleD family two-component response regulator